MTFTRRRALTTGSLLGLLHVQATHSQPAGRTCWAVCRTWPLRYVNSIITVTLNRGAYSNDCWRCPCLALWRPLLPYRYSCKASCAGPGEVVICNFGHPGTLTHWASECPDVKNYKWRLNPVWYTMLYSCSHMATVSVKGLGLLIRRRTRDFSL